jgi:hypothetical protein
MASALPDLACALIRPSRAGLAVRNSVDRPCAPIGVAGDPHRNQLAHLVRPATRARRDVVEFWRHIGDAARGAVPSDAVLQADRERVAAIDNRPAAFEKQASPLLAARPDRPLALIEDEYRQFGLLNLSPYGPLTLPLRQSPLGNVTDRRLSKTRFVPVPGLSCLAFERSNLRSHSDAGLEPLCKLAWGPKLTLVNSPP